MKPLNEMTMRELLERQRGITTAKKANRLAEMALSEELERRLADDAARAYAAQGKEHGVVRVPAGDGIVAKCDTKQKVDWDQEKLRAVAADMSWEEINHYFRLTFDVKESVYKALPPGSNIKPLLTDARTTRLGGTTFELVSME